MKQATIICLILATLFPETLQYLGADSEIPSISNWVDRDWPDGNTLHEVQGKDRSSGCIYRIREQSYAVFYGKIKCIHFPRNFTIDPDITDFRLKTSNIKNLMNEDLIGLTHLESFLLDGNGQLNKIYPATFSNMTNLRNLSISYNTELKVLDKDVFQGLENLEILRLVKNGFMKIIDATQAIRTEYLPKLLKLSLSENSFTIIDKKSFVSLRNTGLNELDLPLCQIEKIAPKSLNVFKNLTHLRLGDNLISENDLESLLVELANNKIPIRLLNLYNMGYRNSKELKKLLGTIAKLNVTDLVLARNHIEAIPNDLFPSMNHLKYLDLREMSVLNVEKEAFSRLKFPNLQYLSLGKNKLTGLLPGVLIDGLTYLDLSDNSGMYSNSYFDVCAKDLNGTLSLKSLDVSYNRISAISPYTFSNFGNLEILLLRNSTIFFIAPRAFVNLTNLKVLDLQYNSMKPFNLFKNAIFDGLVNLEVLDLSYCQIVAFANTSIFTSLINLRYLYLRENDLVSIDPRVFSPLINLARIDLSENRIQPWATLKFENNTNLRTLILSGNRLNIITVAMLEDFTTLSVLDITHNAYFCDCTEFNESVQWLMDRNIRANDTLISSPELVCSAPEQWRDTPLAEFLDKPGECRSPHFRSGITKNFYIFIAVVIVISLVLGALAYIYRWHLRYWLFLTRMAFIRRHGWRLRRNKVHPGEYKYDVFVSYSHEDRAFVVRLVTMLEDQEPFLKLCVYERDFEIGTVISDTVMEKVAISRRTLLIVSNSFAKSQWCMWELQLAEYHRLFFRPSLIGSFENDPLLIIKLGSITPNNMTPTLKFLLKSRIYLEWSNEPKKQVAFWERLRLTLKPDLKDKVVRDRDNSSTTGTELETITVSDDTSVNLVPLVVTM